MVSTREIFYTGDIADGVVVREGEERRPLDSRLDLNDEPSSALRWGNDNSGGI
jgi:hypothetical protein